MSPTPAPILIGQQYGLWTVTALASSGGAYVHAVCACGTKRVVNASSLRLGKSTSCRCRSIPKLEGTQLGRWLVLRHIAKSIFHVRCAVCGREHELHSPIIRESAHKGCRCAVRRKAA